MSSRSGWSSSSFSYSRRSLGSRTSGSHTIGRGLTTLALDALKLALDGAEIKQEGDHFVHIQSELGDRRYRKLCEDVDLTLTEIHYCQEGLDIARINVRDRDQGKELVSQAQVEEMRQVSCHFDTRPCNDQIRTENRPLITYLDMLTSADEGFD